jgi:anti-sigma factor RsiW
MTPSLNIANAADGDALLIHAYVDGELDPANAAAVGRTIAADPALTAEVARIEALRRVIHEQLPPAPLPAHLRAKIAATIGERSERTQPSWRQLAASVALAVALGSGATWLALSSWHAPMSTSADRISVAMIDGHIRSLKAAQRVDVASSDRHTVKPWFNGRIPQSPEVVDLAQDGYPLAGGRVDVINTAPVATLVYGRRLHVISLTAIPDASPPQDPTVRRSIKGYNLVHWSHGGVAYWAASDLNTAELIVFANLFHRAASGS